MTFDVDLVLKCDFAQPQRIMRLFCGLCLATLDLVLAKPEPVKQLDLESFLGRWYQTYGSFSVKYATELGANCVFVDYSKSQGAVALTNSVSVLGFRFSVQGFAVPSPNETGVFDVSLGPSSLAPRHPKPFQSPNYVIVALGPKYEGKYEYAVVTDPTFLSLYILTRDVGRFVNFEQELLEKVAEMGFNSFLNKPRKTNQHGCKYPLPTGKILELVWRTWTEDMP